MNDNVLPSKACLAAILIGLLPAWMILLPLDMTNDPEGWQVFMRANSFAVPLAQLAFVLLAMGVTFSPFRSVKILPRTTKAALLLWVVISLIVSFQAGKDYLSASIGMFKLGIAGLFFLALVNLRTEFGLPFLLRLWVSLGISALFYTALWTIHIFLVSPQANDWIFRMPGLNNVRHTGHFAIAGVIGGLFMFLAYRDNPKIWQGWVIPSLFVTAGLGLALWTGSRGPLLASVVAMFVTICVVAQRRRVVVGFCVAAALTATATVALLPVPHPIYGIAGATGLADMSEQAGHDASSGRTELWKGTITKIAERPILGWGVNQFIRSGPSKPGNFFHPHNYPLQLLFSGGLLSVLILFLLAVPVFRHSEWRSTKGASAAGVGGVVGILVYSLYDGVLYFSYPIMVFLVAATTALTPPSTQPVHDTSG